MGCCLFLLFCFGLYTEKPSADTVIQDLKASYCQGFALLISPLLFCFVGFCSLVLVWTSGDEVFSIMDIKYKSPTRITMIQPFAVAQSAFTVLTISDPHDNSQTQAGQTVYNPQRYTSRCGVPGVQTRSFQFLNRHGCAIPCRGLAIRLPEVRAPLNFSGPPGSTWGTLAAEDGGR